jgi:REP element-mobilizing transposase RayT
MGEPLAYFFTFRTYGTWLHGDERGSVDEANNVYGTPMLPPNRQRITNERASMAHESLLFDEAMRECVGAAMREECHYRGWDLVQIAVQTNHVHVIVRFVGLKPEKMGGCLKSHSTQMLRRQSLLSAHRPVWVDGPGSRRYLWTEQQIRDAEAYVREGQDVTR